jgi:uncharacterized protein (TIGR00290 family)
MSDRPLAALSWSGGKDSCLAYLRVRETFSFVSAITMMNETGARSRSHGLTPAILRAQADALGFAWIWRPCSWSTYEAAFVDALEEVASTGVTHLVCGDILYPEHKQWVERMCTQAGLQPVEPIWGNATLDLYNEFLDRGGVARIVSANAEKLTSDWLYCQLDRESLIRFAALGIDPCGENGEYHTVVTDCPAFSHPLAIEPGEQVLQSGYWAVDVRLSARVTP